MKINIYAIYLVAACHQREKGREDKKGRACWPQKHLATTNARSKNSSEDKKAIELTPATALQMQASWKLNFCFYYN